MNRTILKPVCFLILTCFLSVTVGCSLLPSQSLSHSDSYPISLTTGDYEEPYEEIRIVKTKLYDDMAIDSMAPAELKKLARKYGCDAVIHITRESMVSEQFGYAPGVLFRIGTRYVSKTRLSGVAIRFRRDKILESKQVPRLRTGESDLDVNKPKEDADGA